jgi:hypothetical protein
LHSGRPKKGTRENHLFKQVSDTEFAKAGNVLALSGTYGTVLVKINMAFS